MDKYLESSRCLVYQVSGEPGIARCSHQSDITSWSVDLRASLFTDNRRVILFFACLIFAVDPDRKIILTVKFSQSTAVRLSSITVKLFTNPTFSEVKEVVHQCL